MKQHDLVVVRLSYLMVKWIDELEIFQLSFESLQNVCILSLDFLRLDDCLCFEYTLVLLPWFEMILD